MVKLNFDGTILDISRVEIDTSSTAVASVWLHPAHSQETGVRRTWFSPPPVEGCGAWRLRAVSMSQSAQPLAKHPMV